MTASGQTRRRQPTPRAHALPPLPRGRTGDRLLPLPTKMEVKEETAPSGHRGGRPCRRSTGSRSWAAWNIVRPGGTPDRAAADSERAESDSAYDGTLLFLGHRGRAACRAPPATPIPDDGNSRLRQLDQRVLVRAAAPRNRQSLLLPGKRTVAPVPNRICPADEDGGTSKRRPSDGLVGAGD